MYKLILVIILTLIFGSGLKADKKINDAIGQLSTADQIKLCLDYYSEKPFLTACPDVIKAKETLNHFFNDKIYEKLKGHKARGCWCYDEGFVFEENEIKIDRIEGTPQTQKYVKEFEMYLREELAKQKIKITDTAKCSLGLCIVHVEPRLRTGKEPTYPGLLIEVYTANNRIKKASLDRFKMGKRNGLKYALKEAAEFIVEGLVISTPAKIKEAAARIKKLREMSKGKK